MFDVEQRFRVNAELLSFCSEDELTEAVTEALKKVGYRVQAVVFSVKPS